MRLSEISVGWKGQLAGGTVGTVAGQLAGLAAGGPVGAFVGGAAGGTAGQMAGDKLGDMTSESEDDSPFADELYNALEETYPNLLQKAGAHIVGRVISDFVQFEGQHDPEALVGEMARAIRSNMTPAEF
jgi:hypothetical protein